MLQCVKNCLYLSVNIFFLSFKTIPWCRVVQLSSNSICVVRQRWHLGDGVAHQPRVNHGTGGFPDQIALEEVWMLIKKSFCLSILSTDKIYFWLKQVMKKIRNLLNILVEAATWFKDFKKRNNSFGFKLWVYDWPERNWSKISFNIS